MNGLTTSHHAYERAPVVSKGKRAVIAPPWVHELVVSGQGWSFVYVWSDGSPVADVNRVLNSFNVKRSIERHKREYWCKQQQSYWLIGQLLKAS